MLHVLIAIKKYSAALHLHRKHQVRCHSEFPGLRKKLRCSISLSLRFHLRWGTKTCFSKNNLVFRMYIYLRVTHTNFQRNRAPTTTYARVNVKKCFSLGFFWRRLHMKRTDGCFPTHLKPSKTDQYAKSYSDFSLGGRQLGRHSLCSYAHGT